MKVINYCTLHAADAETNEAVGQAGSSKSPEEFAGMTFVYWN